MSSNNLVGLFSIDNEYNQPSNNLVVMWGDKPTLEVLANALGMGFPAKEDATTLSIVKLWSEEHEVNIGSTLYRLQPITLGKNL